MDKRVISCASETGTAPVEDVRKMHESSRLDGIDSHGEAGSVALRRFPCCNYE